MSRFLPISPAAGSIVKRAMLFAFAATVFAAGCEDTGTDAVEIPGHGEDAIVGGTETGYKSWKGVIGLYYSMGNAGSICTATLVHPQILVTAGHCVYIQGQIDAVSSPNRLLVFGGANLNTGNVTYYPGVSKIVKHPKWTGNINNMTGAVDLAIIKLSAPVNTVETYGVRSGSSPSVGTEGKIVGYGLSSSANQSSAGIHRVGDTTVRSLRYGLIEVGNPAGTCQGDSGGPLFTQQGGEWVLSGVTSFGTSETCFATHGGYDVDVVSNRAWIESTFKQLMGVDLDDGSTGGGDTDPPGGGDATNPCDASSLWGCDPLSNEGCGENGAACDFGADQQDNTGFYCFEGSTQVLGASCDPQNGPWCAGGMTCVQGICMAYCCSADDCKAGEQCAIPEPYWPGINTKQLGVCAALGGGDPQDQPGDSDEDTGDAPVDPDTGEDDGNPGAGDKDTSNDNGGQTGDDDGGEGEDGDTSETGSGDAAPPAGGTQPLTKSDSSSCMFAPSTRRAGSTLELLLGLLGEATP